MAAWEEDQTQEPESHLPGQQRWPRPPWIKQIQQQAVGLSSGVRGTKTGGKGPIPRDEGGGSGSAELSGPPGSGPP